MEQIISALYVRNEQYHYEKEKMIWLVATIYLSFGAGYLKWILTDKWIRSVWCWAKWCAAALLVLVSAIAIIFIYYQNWKKAISVKKTGKYNDAICKLDDGITYTELIEINKYKMCSIQANFSGEGQPGMWLLILVFILSICGPLLIILKPI